mgnify:CR=1 FL=1
MSRTILAVDDSATMLQTISIALENAGHKVVTAKNGIEALERLKGADKFHAIITDINMPEMDGITLTSEIRKHLQYRFTPVIVLTTESQMQKKDEGKKAGATGWIIKPFKPEQLVEVIRKVCP